MFEGKEEAPERLDWAPYTAEKWEQKWRKRQATVGEREGDICG